MDADSRSLHPTHNCYLFAGPSLTPRALSSAQAYRVCVLPPVARGDVEALVESKAPSVLVLADGRFHQAMSVGHVELRHALERGWQLWGVSSMGAVRAFELRKFGMHGFGRVYEMFFRFTDFQDDEVALLHSPSPPYGAGSEPLVHVRVALASLVRKGVLDRAAAHGVLRKLKVLWYGDRTLGRFEALLRAVTPTRRQPDISEAIAHFDRFRIKQIDLTALLAVKPWVVDSPHLAKGRLSRGR